MRRKDREITDPKRIDEILATAKVLHLGLVDGGRPYVVPLHYGHELVDGTHMFWCHGAREGRKVDVIRANPQAFVELECDVEDVCGGEVACNYGSSYACVMGEGTAQLVDDIEAKVHGLRVLMRTQTGRDFEIPEARAKAVGVICIEVPQVSAKSRPKMG